jgi:hypothetical protein
MNQVFLAPKSDIYGQKKLSRKLPSLRKRDALVDKDFTVIEAEAN